MNPADKSFAVHLESLLGFAQELTTQVHGITKPSGELEGLLSAPVLFGAFAEADSLAATHAAAVAEMHVLLADVQEALSFANDVTKTVADGYRRVDADLGAYLGADGVLSGDSGTNPASGAAGPTGVGLDTGGVAVSARTDGHTGLQLSIAGTTVTAGLDGVHIDTSDPTTGTSTAISVPVVNPGATPPPPVVPVTGA
ncbi:MAG: hypothetical protein ABI140_21990 [Jatrophihabitantaceae bacterium]